MQQQLCDLPSRPRRTTCLFRTVGRNCWPRRCLPYFSEGNFLNNRWRTSLSQTAMHKTEIGWYFLCGGDTLTVRECLSFVPFINAEFSHLIRAFVFCTCGRARKILSGRHFGFPQTLRVFLTRGRKYWNGNDYAFLFFKIFQGKTFGKLYLWYTFSFHSLLKL